MTKVVPVEEEDSPARTGDGRATASTCRWSHSWRRRSATWTRSPRPMTSTCASVVFEDAPTLSWRHGGRTDRALRAVTRHGRSLRLRSLRGARSRCALPSRASEPATASSSSSGIRTSASIRTRTSAPRRSTPRTRSSATSGCAPSTTAARGRSWTALRLVRGAMRVWATAECVVRQVAVRTDHLSARRQGVHRQQLPPSRRALLLERSSAGRLPRAEEATLPPARSRAATRRAAGAGAVTRCYGSVRARLASPEVFTCAQRIGRYRGDHQSHIGGHRANGPAPDTGGTAPMSATSSLARFRVARSSTTDAASRTSMCGTTPTAELAA